MEPNEPYTVRIGLGGAYQIYDKSRNVWHKFRDVLRRTSLEVAIVAGIGLFAGWGIGYKMESYREQRIPLGFSEISQIELDALSVGEEVSPITKFLTSTNDVTMKVFECWNDSNKKNLVGDNLEEFAGELYQRMIPEGKKHHYEIYDLLDALPEQSKGALERVAHFVDAGRKLQRVNAAFAAAWDEDHDDHYRTEVYTYVDADGDVHVTTRQVYDYTTHTYAYHREHGEAASQFVDGVLMDHPTLQFTEKIRIASRTNPEGERAAQESRRKDKKEEEQLTNVELRQIANTWYSGSTLRNNIPSVEGLWNHNLRADADAWRAAKNTAHNDRYNTRSRSDLGPKEFQVAEQALRHGTDIEERMSKVISGIQTVGSEAPQLKNAVWEFIRGQLEEGYAAKRKPEDIAEEIMDTAKRWYQLNFEQGFDVQGFRWPVVALLGFAGLIAGGLAGWGVDSLGKRFQWWGRNEEREHFFRY